MKSKTFSIQTFNSHIKNFITECQKLLIHQIWRKQWMERLTSHPFPFSPWYRRWWIDSQQAPRSIDSTPPLPWIKHQGLLTSATKLVSNQEKGTRWMKSNKENLCLHLLALPLHHVSDHCYMSGMLTHQIRILILKTLCLKFF